MNNGCLKCWILSLKTHLFFLHSVVAEYTFGIQEGSECERAGSGRDHVLYNPGGCRRGQEESVRS